MTNKASKVKAATAANQGKTAKIQKEMKLREYQIKVNGVTLAVTESEDLLKAKVAQALGVTEEQILEYQIAKKSLDARDKTQLKFIYNLYLTVKHFKVPVAKSRTVTVSLQQPVVLPTIVAGTERLLNPPIIVGSGPCGLFAALILAEHGYHPLLVERGGALAERVGAVEGFWQQGKLNTESNVQFGQGGAGTFSDGKLTFRGHDPLGALVLQKLIAHGAYKGIAYEHKPHLGTDVLRGVVQSVTEQIKTNGGRVVFNAKMEQIYSENQHCTAIALKRQHQATAIVESQVAVLAIGNGARDTYQMLAANQLQLVAKPFAVGLRLEHAQNYLNQTQYGDCAAYPSLGAADYSLTWQNSPQGRGVYSFCMCPGGYVVNAASEKNMVATNGMSFSSRQGAAGNSAIVVSVTPADFGTEALDGLKFQQYWEEKAFVAGGSQYALPVQPVEEFLAGTNSQGTWSAGDNVNNTLMKSENLIDANSLKYSNGLQLADLHQCLPAVVSEQIALALLAWEKKMPGLKENALLYGIETRTSSPVRMVRSANLEAVGWSGLYVAGEGAGYAGGIISSAIDGIKVAMSIIEKYAPPVNDWSEDVLRQLFN